jgi:heme-degrading monooxygenase HmoA
MTIEIDTDDPAGFEAAFAEVERRMGGTPGHLGAELLRPTEQGRPYLVIGMWSDAAAFRRWEDSTGHPETSAPLRPYWGNARIERHIYEVAQPAEL